LRSGNNSGKLGPFGTERSTGSGEPGKFLQGILVVMMSSVLGEAMMTAPTKGRILTLAIREKTALSAAYMPFLVNGGLFIPTDKPFNLGDEVFLLLTLMDEPDRIPVPCQVVWITPARAQGNRVRGIGVQFSTSDKGATRRLIENHLAGMLQDTGRSHTF
jgi:type IV pilus assembly protein PilZ